MSSRLRVSEAVSDGGLVVLLPVPLSVALLGHLLALGELLALLGRHSLLRLALELSLLALGCLLSASHASERVSGLPVALLASLSLLSGLLATLGGVTGRQGGDVAERAVDLP